MAVGTVGVSPETCEVKAVEPLREVGRNDDDLLPAIDRVCIQAGVTPGQLRRIAVSIGPGGYTSLRVACAAAKMIAETVGNGPMCVPVPTAAGVMVALKDRIGGGRTAVALAGKGESAFVTVFPAGWAASRAAREMPVGRLIEAGDFAAQELAYLVADRHVPRGMVERATAAGVVVVEPQFCAASCLQVSSVLEAVDGVNLLPLYPREPDAVTLWRARKQVS